MKSFRVHIEKTKIGTLLVRSENVDGKRETLHEIKKFSDPVLVDGNLLSGKRLAEAFRLQVLKRRKLEEEGQADLSMKVEPLVQEYIRMHEVNNYAPMTAVNRAFAMKAFLKECPIFILSDITRDALDDWKAAMARQGLKNETIRGRLANARTFINWLVENEKLDVSPFGKKLIPMKTDPPIRYYTAAEFEALDDTLVSLGDDIIRLAANLAHSAGLRKVEMCGDGLTKRSGVLHEDIEWLPNGRAELLVRKEVAKGRKRSRTLPLDRGLIALLGSRRSGPIIPYTRNQLTYRFQVARKKAGINKELTIHGLRHTFAKNHLQSDKGNLNSLQKLMGHSTLASTMVYAQFEKSYLQEAVDRAYERRMEQKQLSAGPLRIGIEG